MKWLWDKFIIWMFWTKGLDDIRGHLFKLAYDQGRFDEGIFKEAQH